MRVLVVDDEIKIAENIKKFLESKNYIVDVSFNGEDALGNIEIENYDAIIIDWMLPDIDGIKLCQKIKKMGKTTPLLMLTAKSQIEDKIKSFECGVDDYLTKPFFMDELFARVKAIIRRNLANDSSPVLKIKRLEINTNTCEVKKSGKLIDLSPKEYALLEYLALNKGIVMNRQDIMEHVWGDSVDPFSNTVDVHIRYIREKLNDADLIKTVKSRGYMLCED